MRRLLVILAALSIPVSAQTLVTERVAVAVLAPSSATTLCPANTATDATRVLDLATSNGYLSLCGLDRAEFTLGVAVIDGPGYDLCVVEENSSVTEPYGVEISADGATWFNVPGPYAGNHNGDTGIDIQGIGPAFVQFVALIDRSGVVTGTTPGPDFDAIYAIHYLPPLFAGNIPHVYPDRLLAYAPGSSTSNLFTDASEALGPPNAALTQTLSGATFLNNYTGFVALPAGASLVVFFSHDHVIDGAGPDLASHEYFSPEDQFVVEASDDGWSWMPMTLSGNLSPTYGVGAIQTANIRGWDLAGTGLTQADHFRVVSTATATTGATPGPDFDALEAISSAPKARQLSVSGSIAPGATFSLDLFAVAHGGEYYAVLPSGTPPLPFGGGVTVGPGVEWRLPLTDPLLTYAAYDPTSSAWFANLFGQLTWATAMAQATVTVPNLPALSGAEVWWHAGFVPTGTTQASGTTNLIWTRIE
ncbi:MAG: hypothetical protein VX913_03635 [Planctomycetota bacterium]|nr:hypothetical protein [Planctomycetota bacterium]